MAVTSPSDHRQDSRRYLRILLWSWHLEDPSPALLVIPCACSYNHSCDLIFPQFYFRMLGSYCNPLYFILSILKHHSGKGSMGPGSQRSPWHRRRRSLWGAQQPRPAACLPRPAVSPALSFHLGRSWSSPPPPAPSQLRLERSRSGPPCKSQPPCLIPLACLPSSEGGFLHAQSCGVSPPQAQVSGSSRRKHLSWCVGPHSTSGRGRKTAPHREPAKGTTHRPGRGPLTSTLYATPTLTSGPSWLRNKRG